MTKTVNGVTIRACYDERERVAIDFYDEEGNHDGLTEQCHKDTCDIHLVLKKFDKTGVLQHVNKTKAFYGDYTEVNEYQESLNTVIRAQNSFAELPATVRKRFGNDPGEYIEFVTNPENMEEMIKLGLAVKVEEVAPQKVEIVGGKPPEKEAGKAD